MKKINLRTVSNRSYLLVALLLFGAIGAYFFGLSHAAGTATLTLSPASSNVSLGSNITVSIVENSGSTAVNAVEADLTYDQTKLQYVSTDLSASPFTLTAQNTGGNGQVNISSAATTAQTGQQTVGTVTFKAIGLGASSVLFANTSGIADSANNTNVLGTATGGTYTVVDSSAPSTPTTLTAGTRTPTSIAFTWTASTDNVAVTGYKIYRGGTQIGTSATTSYTDSGLTPNNSYSYTVSAYDAAGNNSSQSSALATSTLPDTTAPSVPASLTVGTRTLTSVQFTWTASTDNVAVTGYKIYRGGTQIGTSATTSYTDTGLTPGTSYSYTVSANDAAGNNSAQSSASNFSTLADNTAPSVPSGLTTSGVTVNSVTLSWTASTDNVAVTGYKIFRGGVQVGTSGGTSFTNTGLTPGTSYSYTVLAYDAAGNSSAQSTSKAVTTNIVPGDANGDGHVDFLDLSVLASTWQSTTDLRGDYNHDGIVNFLDLSILANNWGK